MSKQVDLLNRETVYQGFFRVDKFHLRVEKFEGGWSGAMDREVFRIGQAANILLYDPRQDKIVLIEQFRMGPFVHGRPPFIFECVAGLMDEGEAPEAAAAREAFEETGYHIKRLQKIAECYSSPGATDELNTMFIGEIDATETGGVFGLADEHENIRVHAMSSTEALAMLDDGKIANGPAMIALLWFARHGQKLRAKWLALHNNDLAWS
jgi:ADP-ribose pyrophosphatase